MPGGTAEAAVPGGAAPGEAAVDGDTVDGDTVDGDVMATASSRASMSSM